MYDKKLKLYNQVEIPQLGLGTWFIDNDKVSNVVKEAIKLGYRHIDTAEAYGNESGVGLGIKESGVKREELFIQTKLNAETKDYNLAIKEIEKSFARLGVDYIDLMIIHSPQPWSNFRDGNHYKDGNLMAWKALCEYYKKGKIRAIGVSNFEIEDIKNLIENSNVKPMVNQILGHIGNIDFELIDYCMKNNIVVEAYSPLGHGEILNNKKIEQMALKYNVSIAQLCIKYTLQLGLVSLPKTSNLKRLTENSSLDFEISEEDMKKLCEIENVDSYGESEIFPCYSKQLRK